jgi:hypothetical protein
MADNVEALFKGLSATFGVRVILLDVSDTRRDPNRVI